MKKIYFYDGRLSRGVYPRLFFIKGNEIIPFKGKSIPNVAVVLKNDGEQRGKWSYNEFELAVANDVAVIRMAEPFDRWGQTFADIREGFSIDNGETVTDELIEKIADKFFTEDSYFKDAINLARKNRDLLRELESMEAEKYSKK